MSTEARTYRYRTLPSQPSPENDNIHVPCSYSAVDFPPVRAQVSLLRSAPNKGSTCQFSPLKFRVPCNRSPCAAP